MNDGHGSGLTAEQREELLRAAEARFNQNMHRHEGIEWTDIRDRLEAAPEKLMALHEMEQSGGEPDVIRLPDAADEPVFMDCSPESPKGRRSCCYDQEALESRKKHKPEFSALQIAAEMGVDLLTEEQYRALQTLGEFDKKTSSWIRTPDDVRKLGGALFCDRRYGRVFTYHNGADSYYAARGFRGLLRV